MGRRAPDEDIHTVHCPTHVTWRQHSPYFHGVESRSGLLDDRAELHLLRPHADWNGNVALFGREVGSLTMENILPPKARVVVRVQKRRVQPFGHLATSELPHLHGCGNWRLLRNREK